MDEQILEEAEKEKELVIEEDTEETEEAVEVLETSAIEVPGSLKESGYKELKDAAFEHAKDTMKEKDKIDWFVLGCGLFAIVCLVISVVNVVRYGFDLLFGVMMAAYVIVAVFCLIRKLQYKAGRAYWNATFKGKIKTGKKEPLNLMFSEEGIVYSNGKKDIKRSFDSLWDSYETSEYFVFHATDRCIIPVSKTDIRTAQEEYEGIDLMDYFTKICDKYKNTKTADEEEEQTEANDKGDDIMPEDNTESEAEQDDETENIAEDDSTEDA